MNVCVCKCTCSSVHVYVCALCGHVYVCVHECVYMCIHVCANMYMHVCVRVYVCVCVHASTCICMWKQGSTLCIMLQMSSMLFFFFFLRKGFWLAKCSPRRLGLLISKSQEPSYLWLPGSVLQIRATQAAFLHRFWEFNQGPHAWVASTLSTVWLHHHHHHQSNISILSL